MECSCKLCPSPGMYAVTSSPFDSRTRATLRSAEFGFLGVMIFTCRQTPFFCGQPCSAGCLGRRYCCTRGLRTSWLIVGISFRVLVAVRRRGLLHRKAGKRFTLRTEGGLVKRHLETCSRDPEGSAGWHPALPSGSRLNETPRLLRLAGLDGRRRVGAVAVGRRDAVLLQHLAAEAHLGLLVAVEAGAGRHQ